MIHNMKINDNAFQRMNNGTKVREYRINNEKRRKVKIGDIIEFHSISNPEDIHIPGFQGFACSLFWGSPEADMIWELPGTSECWDSMTEEGNCFLK